MEKLGYKEGSGLGKNQQGMSMALQVEKTSKRGGKIIHEKDILKSKLLLLLFQHIFMFCIRFISNIFIGWLIIRVSS